MQNLNPSDAFDEPLEMFARQRFGNKSGSGVHDKGQKRVKAILKVAIDLLLVEGFSDFSMRRVANTVGVNLSAVQFYFPTRDDLLRAIAKFVSYQYEGQQQRVIGADYATPLERFEAYLDFSLVRVRDQLGYYMFLGEAQSGSDIFAEACREVYTLDVVVLSQLLAPLLPDASEIEIKQRAAFMSAAIDGLEIYLKQSPQLAPVIPDIYEYGKNMLLKMATNA